MKTLTLGLLLLGIVGACKGSGAKDEHHDDHHHEGGEAHAGATSVPAGTVVIDPEMLRDLRITVTEAEARAGGEGVMVLGELRVNEDAYAEVGSPLPARVVRVLAAAGDTVTAGQPLVELQSVELGKARAELLAARAQAELARQTLARKKALVAERIAPARELEEAQAAATTADGAVRAARASLRALGDSGEGSADASLTLRSPIAGTVLERTVVRGQVTDPARALFRVGDLSRLWLTVHAFERDAVRMKVGAAARVTLPALPGQNLSGTVSLVGSEVEVSSRTIPVRIELVNRGSLRPGMSATAWIPLGDGAETVVAVPAASLQRMHDGWVVFVPRDERTFERRQVGRGRDLGGEVEIVSGLRPDERVVVEGAFLLKAEADKASGQGEHHEH